MKTKQGGRHRRPRGRARSDAAIRKAVLDLDATNSGDLRQVVHRLARLGHQSARDRELVLAKLSRFIEEKERILYDPTPDGLKRGQKRKYTAMIQGATKIQASIQTVLRILGPAALLDDPHWLNQVDRSGMLGRLGKWQDHVLTMWAEAAKRARHFTEVHRRRKLNAVKIYGLGGSAAPHDIAREVIDNFRKSSTPIEVVRADAPNPDHVTRNTLAILASFSGNTEETLNCLRVVKKRTSLLAGISRGGKLRTSARRLGMPFIQLPDKPAHPAYVLQPRESVCLQMTASLVFLGKIGLQPGSRGRFTPASLRRDRLLQLLDRWRKRFGPSVPFGRNPAKQLAFFSLYGAQWVDPGPRKAPHLPARALPYLLGDRNLSAVIHEAATQFRERSKMNVIEGSAPEDLHNSVESIRANVEARRANLECPRLACIFYDSVDSEPRIDVRLQVTRDLVIAKTATYAVVQAQGDTPFERSLFLTYFNAHASTYAAILNGHDPLPVPTMSWLKEVMGAIPRNANTKTPGARQRRSVLRFSRRRTVRP